MIKVSFYITLDPLLYGEGTGKGTRMSGSQFGEVRGSPPQRSENPPPQSGGPGTGSGGSGPIVWRVEREGKQVLWIITPPTGEDHNQTVYEVVIDGIDYIDVWEHITDVHCEIGRRRDIRIFMRRLDKILQSGDIDALHELMDKCFEDYYSI